MNFSRTNLEIETLQEDLSQLQSLLTPLISQNLLNRENEHIRILNLACGRADESGILKKILQPYTQHLHITGVDIRDRELDTARSIWRSDDSTQFDFLHQDATKLDEIAQLSAPFDIAFMRHQNYWNGDLTWKRIYDSALHRLKSQGLLIITSYFDREHILALTAIQQLGATLITTIRNPSSRTINDAPNKSVDRHIAVFKI